jgi:hypothetical protein
MTSEISSYFSIPQSISMNMILKIYIGINTNIFTYNAAAPLRVLAIYYNIYYNILPRPIHYDIDTHSLTIQQYHL